MGGKRLTESTSKKQHRENHIEKIRQSQVLNRLIKHAMGEVEMTTTQVTAAKALIDKYLPTVKQEEQDVTVNGQFVVSDSPSIDEFDEEFTVGTPAGPADSTD